MLKTRHFAIGFVVAVLASLLGFSTASAAGAKSDVCHVNGQGEYSLININDNAIDQHIAHGDASPESAVPGMDGYAFGDDCKPVLAVCESATVTVTVTNIMDILSGIWLHVPTDDGGFAGYTGIFDSPGLVNQGDDVTLEVTVPAAGTTTDGIAWSLPGDFYIRHISSSDVFTLGCGDSIHLTMPGS